MANEAQMTAALGTIFGVNGINVRPEGSVIKIEPFHGKKTEDPVSWLAAFNRAKTTNQWRDDRRVDIAAGYLRGEAAEWFEGVKTDIGVHWTAGANGGNNFTDKFNAQFNTDQRKNEWFHELLTLRQNEDETVDTYAAKFIKLAKRAGVTDDGNKKRMFLHGLRPTLIPFVQMNDPGTLQITIDTARRTEAGFNLSTSKTGEGASSSNPKNKEEIKKDDEINALTQQLQQLTLNYANLTSALMAQSGGESNPRNSRPTNTNMSYQAPRRNNWNPADVTCYRCGRPGHYARECTFQRSARGGSNMRGRGNRGQQTRFVLPANNTRSLNYIDTCYDDDYYEEESYNEYDNYYSEAEIYGATRSGKMFGETNPYPSMAKSKNKRGMTKRSESQAEDQLRYEVGYDSTEIEDVEMGEAETEEETDEEEEIIKPKPVKKVGKTATKVTVPKKIKRKLQPAPIEQVTEFDVAKYISNLPAGLNVGQAAHLIPKYRAGLAASVRRTRNKDKEADAKYVDANEHKTTAMKCEILVGREAVTAIIDSGAA
ncbi:MAG TPA: hypothetical protein VM660_00015, partial [Bacillus sp. (in: firmicutes)]|nr:hypothetical protein [Bacillus sp. (in: firmicutes)]